MITVSTLQDHQSAVPLLSELRATLDSATFSKRLSAALADGYTLLAAEQDGAIAGVLGYRIVHDICWGKTLYVDDLNIAPDLRCSGIGGKLLEAAKTVAREAGCDHLRLCSGLSRTDAHRFYEAHDMQGFSKQFVLKL